MIIVPKEHADDIVRNGIVVQYTSCTKTQSLHQVIAASADTNALLLEQTQVLCRVRGLRIVSFSGISCSPLMMDSRDRLANHMIALRSVDIIIIGRA